MITTRVRPTCDGTINRRRFNCEERARWQIRTTADGQPGAWNHACDRHLAQVSADLLNGEHGDLDVKHIYCVGA